LEISRKVRQPYLIPESLGVLEALADMRKHRRAVAVVVDEYGGVAGMLTVKDLLEPWWAICTTSSTRRRSR
jgi:CBS domain containing-hemolysin-like protein